MKNYFFRIIICAMLLFIKVAYISAQENKANINNSQKDLKFSYINGFFISAIYDENKVHLVWDKYEPSTELSQVFIEKSSDGVNWKLLAVESIDNLIDIHIYNYPSYIQYENNLLYSTEVGYGRFIYNDVCDREELDNPFLRYRAGFITYDGKYLYTSEIEANSNINLEGIRIAEDNEINYNYSEETKQKQKPPIFTTKTVCPSVGSPPSGSTNTGQQQVYYGTCCTWTETLYTLPTTFQIVCGGSSYAWCCNNVTGVSGCTSGYWWDPCCVHTCSQFNSCSCHPWDCCNMIPGQNIWVVTSSTPFSGFQVNSQVINETCPNSSDGSVVLTPVGGTAPFNYTWSTGQTSNSLYFLTAGTYSCTVTDFYGCTVPVTINITSNPNPIANAGVDQTICNGSSATLTATGGVNYYWSNGSTTQSIVVSPTTTQTYTVTVENSFGCKATDDIVVNVFDITSSFTITNPICLENTSTITYTGNGTAAATYNWNFNGGVVVSGSGAGPLQVQWPTGGSHNITLIVNEPGCAPSATTSANINVIDITTTKIENNPLCFGSSDGNVMVIPSGGQIPYSYSWSPGGNSTPSVSGLPQGSYIVTITDNLGCVQIDTLTLVDPPKLIASITNTKPVSCFGGNDGAIIVSATGGTIPYSYAWAPVSGNSNVLTGLPIGNYYVTITDANGCMDSIMSTITEPPLLTATIIDSIDILCNGGTNGSATVLGNGGIPPYSYTWNTNPPQYSNMATNLAAGTYIVTLADANNCLAYDTVTLNEPPALSITTTIKNENCKNYCNGEVQTNVTGGTPPYSYTWNTTPPQSAANATNLCVGTWNVTVTDNNGCIITTSSYVSTNSLITALANANPTTGFVPVPVSFFYTGMGATTYNWDFGDGNASTEGNPTHTYATAGTYNIVLTVNSGAPDFCTDTYTFTLSFEKPSSVNIPNVFTPNNDGINDVFKAESVSMAEETMIIFNRWGKKVFEWNNVGGFWDGENHSDGTYYYIYHGKGKDNVEYNYNGVITIIRSK